MNTQNIKKTREEIIFEKLRTPEEIYKLIKDKYCSYVLHNVGTSRSKYKVGLLCGCFDLCHAGHINLISNAYMYKFEDGSYIDKLIIALNSDISIKILKGNSRPIINQEDRAFTLASLVYVDYITIFDEPVVDNVLKTIQPDYFIKSDPYTYENLTKAEKDIFNEYNIKPLFLPFYKDYSTTKLINIMKEK